MTRLLLVILSFTLCSQLAWTQVSSDQLANEYYINGKFDKAELYYEKLFNESPTQFYFERLFDSYRAQSKFDEAEKLLKKRIRRNSSQTILLVDLGQLYAAQNLHKEAQKEYEKALKELESNPGSVISLARKFVQIGENNYALKAYEKGKELIQGANVFNFELAELYGQMGQYDRMVELYLELIDSNPSYVRSIQNSLNRNFDFEEPGENITALKEGLLKRIQKDPNSLVFSEMLIWLNLQQKDFYGAFIQTKALDARQKENGERLIELGKLYINNQEFELAKKCFETVAKKGGQHTNYYIAQVLRLNTSYQQLASKKLSTQEDWQNLANEYQAYLSQEGYTHLTQRSLRELAEITALRLQKLDEAIALLDELLAIPRLADRAKALAKIDQGDYYLMNNEIWEAALLYGQAEKMFKYDELGETAKFKYGKIGYYTGDFDWAKAQLDVLKGSTSKLIANDAMYISLLITDNSTIDTTFVPMQMFARADLYFAQQRYNESLILLDSIQTEYPGHSLSDDIFYMKYKIHLQTKEYQLAALALENIIELYADDILGDEAHYYLGQLYANYLNSKEKAMEYYEKLLLQYPGSVFLSEARKEFRILRGDAIN